MFTFDPPAQTWHVLEDDPTGEARVLFRKWTAGDRLAYQDAMAIRALTKDSTGDNTMRMGLVETIHLAMTCREAVGFGTLHVERDGVLTEEQFNPRDELHLAQLPSDTFASLSEAAKAFQPIPTNKPREKAAPVEPAFPEGSVDNGDSDGVDVDPFPTPPTPASSPVAQETPPPAPASSPVTSH